MCSESLPLISSKSTDDNIWFSLVIPTYNERENLEPLFTAITEVLDSICPDKYEIILVDDNSPDHTAEVARSLTKIYSQLRVIVRENEVGLGTAVVLGWQQALGDILGVMDGDLQHPAPTLHKLLDAMKGNCDLAIASRYVESGSTGRWNCIRKIISRGANSFGAWMLPEPALRVRDLMSGYFVVKREAVANLPLTPIGYKILLEVLVKGRIRQVTEVPYEFGVRKYGQTKITGRKCLEYIIHLFVLRTFLSKKKSNG